MGQLLEDMPGDKCQGLGSSFLCPELKGNEGWVAPCYTASWPQSWAGTQAWGCPATTLLSMKPLGGLTGVL